MCPVKFEKFPPLPFQSIKEKPVSRMDGHTNTILPHKYLILRAKRNKSNLNTLKPPKN